MTEILINVDFGHPPVVVWRALTDRRVLSAWFMRTDLDPSPGSKFRLVPDGPLGLAGPVEGEVVEVGEHRMVMLWRGEQMHARVTWELAAISGGCRLRMRQTGFVGFRGSARRLELRRTYDRLFGVRLPDVLDQLADGRLDVAEQANAGRSDWPGSPPPPALSPAGPPDPPAGVPEDQEFSGEQIRSRARLARLLRISPDRRGQILAGIGAAVLAVATAAVISALGGGGLALGGGGLAEPDAAAPGDADLGVLPELPTLPVPTPATGGGSGRTDTTSTAGPSDAGGPGAAAPTADVGAAPPAGPTSAAPAPGPPGAQGGVASWAAGYRTTQTAGKSGIYRGEITVSNTGTAKDASWRVTIVLSSAGSKLQTVGGASARQDGTTVTFTAADGIGVAVGGSVTITFQVKGEPGAAAPASCQVNGAACTGL